jgi:molybdate-binding protein/DNA-binding XRE family transcriptional regulator
VVFNDSIMAQLDSIISTARAGLNPVFARRTARDWSQAELAQRAGISRAAVSAIEGERLTPSVTAALALAAVLECSVEELFAKRLTAVAPSPEWGWAPGRETCRYWEAEVNQRCLMYPVEALGLNPIPHDGLWVDGLCRESRPAPAATTLTLASCDPAASLLAAEYARESGFRLLIFPRSGAEALELLRQRRVHVAGLHRSTAEHPERNTESARAKLGSGYQLLRVALWEEGIALRAEDQTRSAQAVIKRTRLWAARQPGSAARECLDELLTGHSFARRQARSHAGVAEAVRSGWAGAGVCVRLCAEEAGLNFLPVRREALDFCFSDALRHDPRIQALVRLLRKRAYRRLLGDLPGYNAAQTGEMIAV